MQKAYLYYEAGQAVAAAHLKLKIRHISADPALSATDIAVAKNEPRTRMILWLTGLATEKRSAGRSSPLRRTRNRMPIRALVEAATLTMTGSKAKRTKLARNMLNQAQDRAHGIRAALYDAVEQVAALLRAHDSVDGPAVEAIVRKVKAARSAAGQTTGDEDPPPARPARPSHSPRRPKKS